MINLLKAEIFRITNTKAFKYAFIATIAISIYAFCIENVWLMSFTDLEGVRYGFNIGFRTGSEYTDFVRNAIAPSIVMYITGISFTTSIMIKTVESGILKNLVAYGYNRWMIYVASIMAIILVMTGLVIIQVFITLGGSLVRFNPSGINVGELLGLLGQGILGYIIAMAAMISIYSVIITILPGSSVISIIATGEIMMFTMFGHMMPQNIVNITPLIQLRRIASYPQDIEFVSLLGFMGLLVMIFLSVGIGIFERKEIR